MFNLTERNNMTMITPGTTIATTILDSGYTFQQEQLLHALENQVCTGMLMCNPRVTGFTSFAKAVLNFIDDKKAKPLSRCLFKST